MYFLYPGVLERSKGRPKSTFSMLHMDIIRMSEEGMINPFLNDHFFLFCDLLFLFHPHIPTEFLSVQSYFMSNGFSQLDTLNLIAFLLVMVIRTMTTTVYLFIFTLTVEGFSRIGTMFMLLSMFAQNVNHLKINRLSSVLFTISHANWSRCILGITSICPS